MALFWKAAGAVLIALILALALGKQEKDMAAVLSLAVCCMLGVAALHYLEPVLDLLWELESLGGLQNGFLTVLIKAVGITLVSETAGALCADAGSGSMGRALKMLGSASVLYLSIPVIQAFMGLIEEVLGNI